MEITSQELLDFLNVDKTVTDLMDFIKNALELNEEKISVGSLNNVNNEIHTVISKHQEAIVELLTNKLYFIHEICSKDFNYFKTKHTADHGSSLQKTHIPNNRFLTEYRNAVSNTLTNPFIHIDINPTGSGNPYSISVKNGSILTKNTSCYPWVLINQLINVASSIHLIQGRKEITDNTTTPPNKKDIDMIMLECSIGSKIIYFDLVENPALSYSTTNVPKCVTT